MFCKDDYHIVLSKHNVDSMFLRPVPYIEH